MEPGWEIWKDGWLDFFDWNAAGGSGRDFGWKFGTAPSWGNQKGFWLESVKVRRLGGRMEMWSGDPKEDITWSNRRFQAWQTCGLGAGCIQWTDGCPEVPKPRLLAHTHQDTLHRRMRSVVGYRIWILASPTGRWPWGSNMGPPCCAWPWIHQSRESAYQLILGRIRAWPRPLDRSQPWWRRYYLGCWMSGAPGR